MPSGTATAVDTFVRRLSNAIPGPAVVVDVDVLESLRRDDAEWAPAGQPLAALRARSTADVETAVRLAAELGVPVVPRGAGTGLSGGANAVTGCLVVDLSRMANVLEIDEENLVAVVQPGVVNNDLKAAVADHGLWYPPDPASAPWSTIGGNVATNAGGLCCLKYGVTRDYVLALEAVVGGPEAADYGMAVRFGHRTNKGVAGYDMVGLLTGSEGTLGVVTEVTLKLRPAPVEPARTVVGVFSSLVDAGRAVALVTSRRLQPAALELLDRVCLQAVEDWRHLGLETDAEVMLLASIDTPGAAGDADAAAVAAAFSDAGALWAQQSSDAAEAELLFAARRLAYPALERLGPVLTEDICVPRSAVPTMLERVGQIARHHDVQIATIAHAGDGNLHPLLITPPDDDAARAAAQAAFDDLLDAAILLGGTVSGEHGIGLLKRGGMRRELDPRDVAMQEAIKRSLDPLDLFNPGKVFG